MKVVFPTERFNESVRAGTVGAKLKRILDEQKPEAVYFTGLGGSRGAILIVEVPEPSAIPALAEPWFLLFDAQLDFQIVMSPEDLAAAQLDGIGQKWS